MAIVKLRKVTLLGKLADKNAILSGLQTLGVMHLIPLKLVGQGTEVSELPARTIEAVRYLEQSKLRLKPFLINKLDPSRSDNSEDVASVVDQVLKNRDSVRTLNDRKDELEAFIKIRAEWGDFEFPPVEEMNGLRFWFYQVPRTQIEKVKQSGYTYEILKEKHGVFYTIVFSEIEPPHSRIPIKRVRTGVISLQALKTNLYEVEQQLEELQLEKASMTRWQTLLTNSIAASIENADYCLAERGVIEENNTFCLSGWLPINRTDDLLTFSRQHKLVTIHEEVSEDEYPPTLLEGKPRYEGAQKIIEFFQLPGYRDWDPSVMVFFSFCLFYSMILSDTGYAVAVLLVLAFFRGRFRQTRSGVALYRMGLSMSGCAIVWGMIVGSYFGVSPEAGSVLSKLVIFDLNDFESMTRLSVGVGVFHLVLANGLAAYYKASDRTNLISVLGYCGWIVLFIASYFYWLNHSVPYVGAMGDQLLMMAMALGGSVVFIFSSERKVSDPKTLLLRLFDGVKAIAGLSKGFGDALSYMRLFALGLSSSQLAITFNSIAFGLLETMPGVGVFLCVLILIIGHAMNLVLGVMGGVVHGLRLNLIEFYHWGIRNEGYQFKPFSKSEDESWKR